MAQVGSLAQELPHDVGTAKEKKRWDIAENPRKGWGGQGTEAIPKKCRRTFRIVSLGGCGSWPGPGGKATFCFSLDNNQGAATTSNPKYLLGGESGLRPGPCLKVLECSRNSQTVQFLNQETTDRLVVMQRTSPEALLKPCQPG